MLVLQPAINYISNMDSLTAIRLLIISLIPIADLCH